MRREKLRSSLALLIVAATIFVIAWFVFMFVSLNGSFTFFLVYLALFLGIVSVYLRVDETSRRGM